MSKSDSWRHDADYIRYVESGESAAVFVVRDVVNAVNTSGKWIAINSMSCYDQEPDGKAFHWIVCELFTRRIQPQYTDDDSDYNKYITWKTAHDDIEAQRTKDIKGPKFLVLCRLINHNKGKFITLKLVDTVKRYKDSDGNIWEVRDYPDEPETVRAPYKPDWEYRITFLTRLSDKQADYIERNSKRILDNIGREGKVTPEIMGITPKPKQSSQKK